METQMDNGKIIGDMNVSRIQEAAGAATEKDEEDERITAEKVPKVVAEMKAEGVKIKEVMKSYDNLFRKRDN